MGDWEKGVLISDLPFLIAPLQLALATDGSLPLDEGEAWAN